MITLSPHDQDLLNGRHGPAAALAMRILVRSAAVMGADRLVDIESAHIDGCLYHGQTSLDFVEGLVAGAGKVVVPTTLNVGSVDLIHPERFRGGEALRRDAQRLMQAHLELGCVSTFTCAPYQLKYRPRLGQQIAWAESNAIVFANSVLGARTNRYGDFIDLCAALTGRAPYCGLHLPENRHGQHVFEVRDFPTDRESRDIWYAALGLWVGRQTGSLIPIIEGLPADTCEDELKALGAAAASSGAVALFHAVGLTPEAATRDIALGGRRPRSTSTVTANDLRAMRDSLNQARPGEALAAVSVGTPHFSLAECARLDALLARHPAPLAVDFYVNTSRYILWEMEDQGLAARLRGAGVEFVTDTCTYLTPIMRQTAGVVMTNSGKWAHYAPGNIGVRVAYGSLRDCVYSARLGKVAYDAN